MKRPLPYPEDLLAAAFAQHDPYCRALLEEGLAVRRLYREMLADDHPGVAKGGHFLDDYSCDLILWPCGIGRMLSDQGIIRWAPESERS